MADDPVGVPERGLSDLVNTVVKGIVSIVFPPGAIAYEAVANPILKRRTTEFMEYLLANQTRMDDELADLRVGQKIDYDLLTSVMFEAVNISRRTRSSEKRKLLANAAINCALGKYKGTDEAMLLHYIDILTPDHFRLLLYFRDPRTAVLEKGIEPGRSNMTSVGSYLRQIHPDLCKDENTLNALLLELRNNGLMTDPQLGTTMTWNGALQGRLMPRGRQLIEFVLEPNPSATPRPMGRA